jgi:regulation of enolase protein 1 (concanavalin A-like superfamily)
VQASVKFDWKEKYDQAGLLLSFRKRGEESSSNPPSKWIKTGIEFYNGKPMLSTVACDNWADWSIGPLPVATGLSGADIWTTILIEKEEDENGLSLRVYHVNGDEKTALREITWVYGLDTEAWDVEVWAMAARPAKKPVAGSGDLKALEVSVKDMVINWSD